MACAMSGRSGPPQAHKTTRHERPLPTHSPARKVIQGVSLPSSARAVSLHDLTARSRSGSSPEQGRPNRLNPPAGTSASAVAAARMITKTVARGAGLTQSMTSGSGARVLSHTPKASVPRSGLGAAARRWEALATSTSTLACYGVFISLRGGQIWRTQPSRMRIMKAHADTKSMQCAVTSAVRSCDAQSAQGWEYILRCTHIGVQCDLAMPSQLRDGSTSYDAHT